jgi:hypothetical protein
MSVGAVSQGRTSGVEAAIQRAAGATGVAFDFLMRTARRESSLNPQAKARTSSAAGLFQFIDQTWLSTLKQHGASHGYGRYSELIQRGSDGRLRVAPGARETVMNLRFDPQAASLMAAELANDHAAYLRGRIGREPNSGELYAAHFLGPAGSARLIQAADRSPGAVAADLFPDAARANRSIFYRGGQPASVSQVLANLSRNIGGGTPAGGERSAQPDGGFLYASRLQDLASDRSLLALALGDDATTGSAFATQMLAAFGPERET